MILPQIIQWSFVVFTFACMGAILYKFFTWLIGFGIKKWCKSRVK